jgi:large subunit ribosomal protein L25
MEQVVLEAKSRTPGGKGAAHRARQSGLVPGVAYGHGLDPMPLVVDERTLATVLRHHRGGNVLFDLRVDGKTPGELAAIVKALQTDPVTDDLLAVDFQWVSLREHVTVHVAVRLEGTAVGAEQGGVVDQMTHEVQVSCLPLEMPEELTVDIRALEIGDTLHVSALQAPEGVTILSNPEEPLVTVRPPVVIAEVAPEVEEVEGEAAEEAAEGEAAEAESPAEAEG